MASYDMDTDTPGDEQKKSNTITFRFCREWYVHPLLLPSYGE